MREGDLSDQDTTGNGLRKDPVLGVETVGEARVVRLVGELDLYNADRVRQALTEAGETSPARIIVDLAEVEFIDSTALGVLIEGKSRLDKGGAFLLASPGLETRRALKISGLDQHFSVHDSVTDALAARV
jgi:anti-sigma B factor antagonist